MYHWVEDKDFLARAYHDCADIVNQLVQELKNYEIDARMNVVGSKKRNMITQNAKEPIDFDFNLLILNADDYSKASDLKEDVREAYNTVLESNGWDDCDDSTSALTTKKMVFKKGNKTPFSIENPIIPVEMEMITLMSLVGTYMVGGSCPLMMPGGAGRDIGVAVNGDIDKWMSYDLALMNGAGRNRWDDNSWKDFVGRVTFHPIKELDLSGSVIAGKGKRSTLAEYLGEEDPTTVTGDYTRNRFAAGFELKTKPVNLRGEWMWGKDDQMKSNGGYATAQINNVGVKNLDIVASVDYLDKGDEKVNRYQAGLQYWVYKKCRIQACYSYTDYDGLGHEQGILTQVQVAF